MANQQVQDLLNRELSRREFLAMVALAAGSLFGLGTIIKLLTDKSLGNHQHLNGYSQNGYGE